MMLMLHRFRPWIFLPWQIPFCHRFDNGFCPVKTTDLTSKRLHTIIDLHHLSLQHRTRKTHSIIYTESKHMIAHPWRVLCAVGGVYIYNYILYIIYMSYITYNICLYIYICILYTSIIYLCNLSHGMWFREIPRVASEHRRDPLAPRSSFCRERGLR